MDGTASDPRATSLFVSFRMEEMPEYTPVERKRGVNDNGILQVADARTGREIYKARVGGGGTTFSSSPLEGRPHP